MIFLSYLTLIKLLLPSLCYRRQPPPLLVHSLAFLIVLLHHIWKTPVYGLNQRIKPLCSVKLSQKRPSTKQYSLEITPFLKSPWGEGQVKVAAIPKMSKQPFHFLFTTVYSHTGNSYVWQEPLQRLFSREV